MKAADLVLRLQQLRPDAEIIAVDKQGYHHAVESLAVGRELYPTIKLKLSPGAVPCDGVNSHLVETRAESLKTILDEIEAHLMGAPREVLTADIQAIHALLQRMAWPGERPSLEIPEPVGTIHEDGYWLRADNPTGRRVSQLMSTGQMNRAKVYLAPPPQSNQAET